MAMEFVASVTDLVDDEELRPGKIRLLSMLLRRHRCPLGEIERREPPCYVCCSTSVHLERERHRAPAPPFLGSPPPAA